MMRGMLIDMNDEKLSLENGSFRSGRRVYNERIIDT